MTNETVHIDQRDAELEELRHQLFEANETLEAIRMGQVDALVVQGQGGNKLYTLKTADLAYRIFIEKMTEGAVTLSREGIILYCNSQFADFLQESLAKVLGKAFNDFVSPEYKAGFQELFERAWTADQKEELVLEHGTTSIPVTLSLTPLKLDDDAALSIIVTDLTKQKKTQEQLETSNHDLQQFAWVASHDLQEPLRKMQTLLTFIIEKNAATLSAETLHYMDRVMVSASRMKNLIVDVLNYSRLSSKDVAFVSVGLNEIVAEIVDDFELLIREKKAVIDVGVLPVVMANRGQIRQVFQNLLSNGLKFSRPGYPPRITISASYTADRSFESPPLKEGPYTLLTIQDNGIGFDEKFREDIFSLFQRLHAKDSYEGTGIGLAVTRRIIEKHKGLIKAHSIPGQGSTFLVLLPSR